MSLDSSCAPIKQHYTHLITIFNNLCVHAVLRGALMESEVQIFLLSEPARF